MVAYGLHEPYHAVVLRDQTPFPVQYAVDHAAINWIRLRQKHKNYTISRLLQQNLHLSEILRLLPIYS